MNDMSLSPTAALLTVAEMAEADRLAIAGGTPGLQLMEAAGAAVAAAVRRLRHRPGRVAVLCGPGNNGGDGYVAARLLHEAGWDVALGALGTVDALPADARANAERWAGPTAALDPSVIEGADVVVDALFGAGLSRPPEGAARAAIEAIGHRPCVAVDMPSGVDGDTGALRGAAPHATATVTFFRKKPGHLLMPGRALCGETIVADIGIPDAVLQTIAPRQAENRPALWLDALPVPGPYDHKYSRGHALVFGGAQMTGAARLAARAAQRAGAGMVTIACPQEALTVYKVVLESILVHPVRDTATFSGLLDDRRVTAALLGPGAGLTGGLRERVLAALAADIACVLDADALTVFENGAALLFDRIEGPCLLTPHEGEFRRLFPDLRGDRLARARAAAKQSGAVVLLKGYDTVIAAPDGRAAINANAPADLATAGSGDVLSGIATGLMAQGMEPFEAAAAAAWMHGAAAERYGAGLIAEDLIDGLPAVLAGLRVLHA